MNNKTGFTLIEVMIATLIMVLVLGALVYSLSLSSNLTETVRNQDIALNAAREKLEEIRNDINNIENYSDPPYNPFTVGELPQGSGAIDITELTTDELYDVTITISWVQRAGRQLSRSLSTTLVRK